MRMRVDPRALRDDLLKFLRTSSCLAVEQGADGIDAQLLNKVSERHGHAVIIGYVEAWKARQTSASVEIVSRRAGR